MDRKATDKRLRRTYGISIEEYEEMLKVNDGACWICGYIPKPDGNALSVDHDHKLIRAKIRFEKVKKAVVAVFSDPVSIEALVYPKGIAERVARQEFRFQLKRASVRGLLCWACNTLLKKGRDCPEILESAARYLRKYKEKFGK